VSTAADTFREIGNQVDQTQHALDNGSGCRTVREYLGAIQMLAQNGLRDSLANEPKLAAFDSLLDLLVATLSNLTRFCREEFHQIYTCGIVTTERKDGAALLLSDATSALARVKEYRAAIANAKQQTGEPR
jgi:hypothetical protein